MPPISLPGATYASLGDFIGAQSPYGAGALPDFQNANILTTTDAGSAKQMKLPLYAPNNVVQVYGISEANNAGNLVTFMPEAALIASLTPAEKLREMRWTIRDDAVDAATGNPHEETHLVTKAIRVWYTYKTKDASGNDIDVGTFLLIGFVGHGQP